MLIAICICFASIHAHQSQAADAIGLQQGDPIGAFRVVKAAGAAEDEVEIGQELCYRCRYGSRPMVMVFLRSTEGKVAELTKKLDQAIAEHSDAQLKGLVTLLGEDAGVLKSSATKFVAESGVANVPIVVAKEIKTGPLNYRLPEEVEVMIVVASDSQVVSTHASDADAIEIDTVMKNISAMLKGMLQS